MAKLIKNAVHTEMSSVDELVDVFIIGAGPVGLFAAFQCYLCGLKSIVIDALPQPGGQCIELYPDKPIFDIPAIPVCSARELIDNLLKQLNPVDTPIYLEQEVISITKLNVDPDIHLNQNPASIKSLKSSLENDQSNLKNPFCWLIKTNKNNQFRARNILFTTGAGKYQAQKLSVDHADVIESKYLHYAISNPQIFSGQRIVIAGGGDSALDWAISLVDQAKITLVHRRAKFSAQPATVAKFLSLCDQGKIDFQVATIANINLDENKRLASINTKDINGIINTIEADHLIVLFGLVISPNNINILSNNFAEHKNLLIVDPTSFQTSIPSIYAAGDIAWYPNKHKLILSGFHESALAARHILLNLNIQNKKSDIKLSHSSNNNHLLKAHHKI